MGELRRAIEGGRYEDALRQLETGDMAPEDLEFLEWARCAVIAGRAHLAQRLAALASTSEYLSREESHSLDMHA